MTTEELLRLRMRGSFGTPLQADPFAANLKRNIPLATPSPLNPPDTGLSNLRALKTPALDEYRSYLSRAPKREDYQLSGIGKALAAISGFGEGMRGGAARAYETSSAIMDEPYRRASEDYNTQGGRMKELADLEYRGLTDDQKLQVQLAEHNLKLRDQIIKEIKTGSDIKVNDAQIKNLMSQAEQRGWTPQRNELTGQLVMVNSGTGETRTIGQFMQTPEAKKALEFKFFQKEEGVREAGRRSRQEDAQAHDITMAGIKFGNDKALEKFKQDLSNKNLSPTQNNAAFEGAYKQVLTMYPEMKDQLFKTDDNGNLVLKEKYDPKKHGSAEKGFKGEFYNPEVFDMFQRSITEIMNQKKGEPSTGYTGPHIPSVSIEDSKVAPVVETDPLRAQAIQFLKDNDFDETDEENITNAMAKIKEESTASSANTPTVTYPVSGPGGMGIPSVSLPNIGMPASFGSNVPYPYGPVNQIDARAAISNMWNSMPGMPNIPINNELRAAWERMKNTPGPLGRR